MTALNPIAPRGYRGRGGGLWRILPVPPTYRGTTVQVCGMWPFAAGSARPNVGVPVGVDIETGATVCCDHFSWFQAGLISSPSMSVYGLQGLGKSSWTCRQIIGLADRGIVSVIAGDLKGEYTGIVKALGGQVISFGGGQQLNVLDQGQMLAAANRIGGERGDALVSWAVDRATDLVVTLIQIVRRSPATDWEHALVRRAIRVLIDDYRRSPSGGEPPALPELVKLLLNPTSDLLTTILADDMADYAAQTKPLNRSLQAVLDGPLGDTFGGQTTERVDLSLPAVSVDISVVAKQTDDVLAAIMVATWSEVFATIEASNALADADLQEQRYVNTVMDEMWRPMRLSGARLVDKLDAITRLNRNDGSGNIFITHSLKDYESMESAADNVKARGFAERSGIVVTAGLAEPDLRELSKIKRLSEKEISTVSGWATPPGWQARTVVDHETGKTRPATPPGAGKVLIKVGGRAGIQNQVVLTTAELELHDTNARWVQQDSAR
ncbi:ATP/GTP-binding protein [Nocardioides sp. Bht2]|uniref:ATP/GTP-binding protein n=1 Tax=Nocardioides sp. Bht2 TaxID=3392297 RepID=UPI0039B3DC22